MTVIFNLDDAERASAEIDEIIAAFELRVDAAEAEIAAHLAADRHADACAVFSNLFDECREMSTRCNEISDARSAWMADEIAKLNGKPGQ